jgi:uncharacterized protein YraI
MRVNEIFRNKNDIINCDLTHNGVTYKNLIDIEKHSYADNNNNKAYTDYTLIFENGNEVKFKDIDKLSVGREILTFECNKNDVNLADVKGGRKRKTHKRKTHKRKTQRHRGGRRK